MKERSSIMEMPVCFVFRRKKLQWGHAGPTVCWAEHLGWTFGRQKLPGVLICISVVFLSGGPDHGKSCQLGSHPRSARLLEMAFGYVAGI